MNGTKARSRRGVAQARRVLRAERCTECPQDLAREMESGGLRVLDGSMFAAWCDLGAGGTPRAPHHGSESRRPWLWQERDTGTAAPDRWRQPSPLAGPASWPGPGRLCSSTRGARSLLRLDRPLRDLLASSRPAMRGKGDRATVSCAGAGPPYAGAAATRCLPAPLPLAGPYSITAPNHVTDNARPHVSRPIPNSFERHKGALCRGSMDRRANRHRKLGSPARSADDADRG